jgi:hypothetical protein
MRILNCVTATAGTTAILAMYVVLPLALALRTWVGNWDFAAAGLLVAASAAAIWATIRRIVPQQPAELPNPRVPAPISPEPGTTVATAQGSWLHPVSVGIPLDPVSDEAG